MKKNANELAGVFSFRKNKQIIFDNVTRDFKQTVPLIIL